MTKQDLKPLSSRAVIYTRVSTGAQQDGTSLASQFAACHTKAQQLGARVVASFEDVQSGADYRDRDGMQQALQALENGEADTLIIYDMSRYSRDLEHQQIIKKRVLAAGGNLQFCTMDIGNLGENAESHLSFGVSGVFAEYERLKIRERTLQGKRRTAAGNRQPCRAFHPFGYHIVTKDDAIEGTYSKEQIGQYIVVEEEAEWVRGVFERYEAGETIADICKWLDKNHPETPRHGSRWHPGTIKRLLDNPVYKGKGTYGRVRRYADESRLSRGLKKHAVRRVPESDHLYIDAPAIVSEELWNRCQQKRTEHSRLFSVPFDRRWMLTGLLRCPLCGGNMVSRYNGSRNLRADGTRPPWREDRYMYKCIRATRDHVQHERCKGFAVFARAVEKSVVRDIISYANHPEKITEYWTVRNSQQKRRDNPIPAIEKKLVAMSKREEAIIEAQVRAVETGAISIVYERKLRELIEEKEELQKQLAAAKAHQKEDDPARLAQHSSLIAMLLQDAETSLTSSNEEVATAIKQKILATVIDHIIPRDREGKIVDIVFKNMSKT